MRIILTLLATAAMALAETATVTVDKNTAAYLAPKTLADFKAANSIGSASFPTQTGHAGEFLSTNGTVPAWLAVSQVPSMTGNSGKVLTNNGTASSWAAVSTLLGTNLQAFDALTGAANKFPYFTGVGTLALADVTSVARTFLAQGTVQLERTALVVPGLATDNAFTGTQSFTLPLLTGSFAVHPGDSSSIFLVDTKQIDLLAGALGSVNVIADGIIFDGAMSFTGGTLDMGPAVFSSGTVMTLTGGVFISGGSTLEDDFDVSAASFSGTMQLDDGLTVAGDATFNHLTRFFAPAANATPGGVFAAPLQTAEVWFWADNGDADKISITKDIDLQMGGNNILGAASVTATTFTGAVVGNASTATALQTGRTFSGTGDATWTSAAFNGTANETAAVTVVSINGTSLAGLGTGILKNTTTTGVPSIAVAGDFPTLNQNTTGSAATLTTGRTIGITGDVTWTSPSFNGSGNVTAASTVTAINGTTLSALGTGILKNTTATGVPSIAVAGDFPTLNQNTTGSAATLTTARTINGTSFNGSANITVTAAAGTLTGATLASGVTASSLTSTGTLTALTVSGTITATTSGQAVNLSPTGSGTVTISPTGGLTINPGGSAVVAVTSGATGSLNNMTIGATTRGTGAFTTLAANGAVTFTAGTASTNSTTGTLVVTGGMAASGNISAGAPVRLKGYTVAGLPAGTQGDFAFVTDAVAPVFLGTLTGGGSTVTLVFYNGTAWVAN